MQLEQFNLDLDSGLKKKFKVEAVEMGFTHAVLFNTMVEDFYKRHRSPAMRRKLFAAMRAKIENGGAVEIPTNEAATLHHVEFADAAQQ